MPKIAFIGAGSYGFTLRLVVDVLSYDSLRDSELVFMDVDNVRLSKVKTLIGEYYKKMGLDSGRISFTRDRKKALEGADFVLNLVKIGFQAASDLDMDLPKKHGLKATIGDTCGLGGVFRALRTIPFCIDLCKEMEDVSSREAVVLNYTNPQAMLVMACAASSRIPFIGLCHSVQNTTREVSKLLKIPYEEMNYEAAGINHMSWLIKLEHKGKDLYPRLKKIVKDKGIYADYIESERLSPMLGPSRLDMMMRVGYMVTESSTHFPEYVPFYLRDEEHIAKYRLKIDCYKSNLSFKDKQYNELYENAKKGILPDWKKSHEYGSVIINSMVTGETSRIYANVPNHGLIDNLPHWSAVEVASLVDKNGVHPCHFGALPSHLAALCTTNILVHQQAVEAILLKSRRKVYQALMLDPLTHTKLDLDQIEAIVDELVDKQKSYLGKYLGKKD